MSLRDCLISCRFKSQKVFLHFCSEGAAIFICESVWSSIPPRSFEISAPWSTPASSSAGAASDAAAAAGAWRKAGVSSAGASAASGSAGAAPPSPAGEEVLAAGRLVVSWALEGLCSRLSRSSEKGTHFQMYQPKRVFIYVLPQLLSWVPPP